MSNVRDALRFRLSHDDITHQGARLVHFLSLSAIVIFPVIHVTLALLVPRTIGAILTGGPTVDDGTSGPSDIDAEPKLNP